MDQVTITIEFQLTNGENQAARLLIAEALDEIIAEAISNGDIDSGDAEILSYQVNTDD
jgi:hypothetical protein